MTYIAHQHVRTRSIARWLPARVIRLLVALGIDRGLLWTIAPHHPECTAEYGVLEVKA